MIYKKCQNVKHKSGIRAEIEVSKSLKDSQQLIFHRVKTPFGELDLLTLDVKQNISIFEVKFISELSWALDRLSQAQTQRLKKCHEWIYSKTEISAHLEIVFVHNSDIYRHPVHWGDL